MEEIYALSDKQIQSKIGNRCKQMRLRQNITQQSLAQAAGVSLSTLKKIESGDIGAFDSLLRVLRILGGLEILQPFAEDDVLSPSEYFAQQHSAKKHLRKRAAGVITANKKEEEAEW